ncbi:nucleotide disphospho-sugar-binding domain-containing protein [Kutzneria sp. CA-103260]|uniref:nucleotide disphospho-sugar-binding domain-containing protein n=1 Tax=Kutzneria sp. CA-103260 TaxID=2802641 RepID=UPI001BADA7E1|nr:nucleotide disphospho-sugar-binding domain-containing protein [Kutzneria sp. CA-103260]QUQ71022.1 glycosyl transferase family protein [Kutzneria sp. CA-103260]
MRVLVTASPGLGHMLPMVSISWALRAAGHEVLLAMAGRNAQHVPMLAASGLHVVETQPPETFARLIDQVRDGVDIKAIQKMIRDASRSGDAEQLMNLGVRLFAPQSDVVADTVVAIADEWRPDLVVHSPMEAAGPLAAAKLGVPAVEQAYGLHSSETRFVQLAEAIADTYGRHGVDGPPARHALLNVAPPSMGTPNPGWAMRYVPFNGGGQLPDWLLHRPDRPRVIVTLGTVIPGFVGLGPLQWLADVAGGLDAEFVVTLDDTEAEQLGALPDNVRPVPYTPLNALLATSAAIIHHGGSGSTMTSLAMGVPQLVVPQGADQFNNAHEVAKRGAGFEVDTEVSPVGADDLVRLLTDASLATAAAEVKAEIAARPAPADLVSRLVELAG